jgi:hypothetical protein
LYDTHHLWMPRVSAAYTLSPTTVVRGGVGVFYDKPEGNVVFSQVNLPPFVPSVGLENANLGNPLAGRAAADSVLGTVNAIQPDLDIPRQINFSVSLQRELWAGHFGEVAYVGNRGRNQLWFPEINNPSFEALAGERGAAGGAARQHNYLRPYQGYSSIRQRRSDAFSNYNGLQLYLNRRKGVIRYTASYTLSKAIGNASGIGDNPEGRVRQGVHDGPAVFDRRHAMIRHRSPTPRVWSRRRDSSARCLAAGSSAARCGGSRAVPDRSGNTVDRHRRADYVGGEIALDDRGPDRWFNTEAFAAPPETRRGNAKVGQVEGPHFYRWDLSLRKRFYHCSRQDLRVPRDAIHTPSTGSI